MGMFTDLMNKIFHNDAVAAHPHDAAKPATVPGTAATPITPVDVNAVLTTMASKNNEKLEWKTSIVDLLKLVGMDSSLGARKSLAADLKFTGDTNDSAAMNIWLHKEVMKQLAANGGKVPAAMLA